MPAPTLSIEGIQVFRGWDEHRIPGDHSFDNIITWNTPSEAGVTEVEIWAEGYTTGQMYLLATVATDVEQITADPDIYTILRTGEFQTYSLRAKNADGFGPWSNAPRVTKNWDGKPNHPPDQNEHGFITGLEVVGSDVKINWEEGHYGAFVSAGVRVYRFISGSSHTLVGTVLQGVNTFTDTTITQIILPGQIVQYAIAVLDERGRTSRLMEHSPFLPLFTSNRVSYVQEGGTEGVGFLVGFFSDNVFKLNWGFSKTHSDSVFEIQRARPRASGVPIEFTWNTYDSIHMDAAYVGDYLDSNHGLYEFIYPDDTSTQWAFRVVARTTQGVEYFSRPFFLAPAPPLLLIRRFYAQYFQFQVSHSAFFPYMEAYYHTMKAYKQVNGGDWSLLWTVKNYTANQDVPPGWIVEGTPTLIGYFGPTLSNIEDVFPPKEGAATNLRIVDAGVPEGTIQFKVEISSTSSFNNLVTTSLSEVFSFDQLS